MNEICPYRLPPAIVGDRHLVTETETCQHLHLPDEIVPLAETETCRYLHLLDETALIAAGTETCQHLHLPDEIVPLLAETETCRYLHPLDETALFAAETETCRFLHPFDVIDLAVETWICLFHHLAVATKIFPHHLADEICQQHPHLDVKIETCLLVLDEIVLHLHAMVGLHPALKTMVA